MTRRHTGDDAWDTSGRLSSDETGPAEAAYDAPGVVPGDTDPDVEQNLGAEFPLRGDQLENAIEAAKAECEEWRDKALRAQAEFENARKRMESRHHDEVLRAGERVVKALFPVIDDMERAIDHAVSDGSDVGEGLAAVHRKLLEVIQREGCSPLDPFGEPFDPMLHNAVQMREDTEVAENTVVEVLQRGYEMHGRVLRPAMVVVSTGGPAKE